MKTLSGQIWIIYTVEGIYIVVDIEKLCEEAIKYQTASVCIPPCYIARVHENTKIRLTSALRGFRWVIP